MPSKGIQVPPRVEEFFREHRRGRRRILALTYEFDPAAFERTFATILRWPIQVDVVAGKGVPGTGSGARYWGARWSGTFHPKVIALLANDRVRVGFGSANLTSGGLRDNLEAWEFFDTAEDQVVLSGFREFLIALEEKEVLPAEVRIKEFIEALPKESNGRAFLSSVRAPLISQVVERLRGRVHSVDIISPINCDPTRVVARIRKLVGGESYRLFAGDRPVPKIAGISDYFVLERPDPLDGPDIGRAVSGAHAKMYAFRSRGQVDLFWGSANLSYSAWIATGDRANIDFLLHSRVSEPEWRRFLEKDLPQGHRWARTPADGPPPISEVEEALPPWRLLHAAVRRGRVMLAADKDGRREFRLRSEAARGALFAVLTFRSGQAQLPSGMATALGFGRGSSPGWLEWSSNSPIDWRAVPVNDLDSVGGVRNSADLAQQLFWEYSGRQLPGLGPAEGAAVPGSDEEDGLPPEEEELTRSEHQGALDRFVLQWRSIARRVAAASGANKALRRNHRDSILERIDAEAREVPALWTPSRIFFVKSLLERKWPV